MSRGFRLSTQVGLLFIACMTLVVGLISWINYSDAMRQLPEQAEHEVSEEAELIARAVASDVLYQRAYPIWTLLSGMLNDSPNDTLVLTGFSIVDAKQQVLSHSSPRQHPLLSALPPKAEGIHWQKKENRIEVVVPVLHPNSHVLIGYVSLDFDTSIIAKRVVAIERRATYAMLGVLVLALLISLVVRQRVAKPLRMLNDVANAIGSGKVSFDSGIQLPAEIEALGQALLKADRNIARQSDELKRLAAVIEQADELVILTDTDGVIRYVNPAFCRISGYSREDAIGNTPSLVKSGEHDAEYYERMWRTLLDGKAWKDGFQNRRKDGSIYHVTQTISPVYDVDHLVGFAAVQRDVTQLRLVEEKLHHTDRVESLGVLAGGIAHDFNNLLTAILGNAAIVQRRLEPESPVRPQLESIEKASNLAANLCRQMLAYSGKGKFVVGPVNMSELIEQMGKLIEVAVSKHVSMQYRLDAALPFVEADVAQMQQVVLNLMTNASEAIGEGKGEVSLKTGVIKASSDYLFASIGEPHLEAGRYVYLEISDTGCGMDAETQKKIFDPFFTTKFTGRGLGMSAMLGIVKGHKGAMRISSEPGQGTTIRVLIPEAERQPLPEATQEMQPLVEGHGLVLVVDDEPVVREVAGAMLEDMGYQVIYACDGLEAVELYRQHTTRISVVLLDMTMPRMDGESCFRELRQINPGVQVILSSGYNEQEATSRFSGKGLAGFIQKPYSPEQLSEVIRTYREA